MDEQVNPVFIRGDVTITQHDATTGLLLHTITSRNTVVQGGLSALSVLLAQPAGALSPTRLRLSKLRVGRGNTAASVTDTELSVPLAGGEVDLLAEGSVVVRDGRVVVVAVLPATFNATRVTLQEAGLYLSNEALFARHVHAPVTTSPGSRTMYSWTLTFSAA